MKKRSLIVLLVTSILFFLSGCGLPEHSPANFEAELEKNRAKWDGAHITHYKMAVEFSGYGHYSGMPWTLEVEDEKVVSAIDVQGYSVSVDDAASFMIAALFVDIEQRYQDRAPLIQVSYNPTYGYPEDISINPYREPCCQGYDIQIRDFQVSPQHTVLPTHTPRMTCAKYPGIEATEMESKSDSLWVASRSSVIRLDTQSLKTEKTIEFPDLFSGPRLLLVTDHGVWVDGLVDWAYYDEAEWTQFGLNRGVAIDEITPPIYQ